ncbi:ATP-binding protein [Allobaculum fili]|uniref:ATP-binding protein n=3 Tax=Allobaculum TaxID=174708 RepID=UPI001E3DEAD9|nr:ATP-binding protein [Allobaculum fili]
MVKNPFAMVVFGQEGVGKTTFASLFPRPWFIDCEGSTKWIDSLQDRQYYPRPKSWAAIKGQIEQFKRELPGDTLVIDTADWLESRFLKDLCINNHWDSLGGQNDHGKSYNILDKAFREFLDELTEIEEMGVIILITAHSTIKPFTAPDERGAWDRYQLKLQNKTSAALKEWADGVFFLKFDDIVIQTDKKGEKFRATGTGGRIIQTEHSAMWDGKNRWDLPSEMPFENKQLPQPLIDLISKCLGTPDPAPSPTPTPTPSPAPASIQPTSAPQPQAMTSFQTLCELMEQTGITAQELETAVDRQPFFGGQHVEMTAYPADFIEQVLIAQWAGLSQAILSRRTPEEEKMLSIDSDDLPF